MSNNEQSQQWGTKIGVVLAVAGSAVGLGNFLRFPGQAAQNGGGAFMVPYFIALLLLGIPIGWAEWTMGRWGGKRGFHSAPFILGAVGRSRIFRYLGILGILIPLCVSFYYTYIEAWCLGYALKYITGQMSLGATITEQKEAAGSIFGSMVGIESNGIGAGGTFLPFILWCIVFAINITLVYRGISGGVEKFCQLAMPTMAVCAVIVLVRVLTLGTPDPAFPDQNVINGLGFMWDPKWEDLTKGNTWLAAAGQIFFSLSVGFGVILNYSSYMKKDSDVVLSGVTAAATNEVFEVSFGGLITVTSAFIFLGATGLTGAVLSSGFALGFNALPVVFAQMGTLGTVIGFFWFFMLFLAAITSSISMYQPTLAFLEECLGKGRAVATGILVVMCMVGSFMVMYFSKDLAFLSTVDEWVGTLGIYILAMIQLLLFSYVFGVGPGVAEAHLGAKLRIPEFYKQIIRFVSPVFLLVVFGYWAVDALPGWLEHVRESNLRQYALGMVVMYIAILAGFVQIGEERLARRGIPIDGIDEPGPSTDSGPAGLSDPDEIL